MSFNRTTLNFLSRSSRIAVIKKPITSRLIHPGLGTATSSLKPTTFFTITARTMATTATSQQSSIFGHNGLLNHTARPSPVAAKPKHRRDLTDDMRVGKIYSFEDLKAVAGKDKSIVIVDCREPHEISELGRIPGAINIPVDTEPDSYAVSDEEFQKRFGYSRPPKDAHLVTYCRAGVRCHTAAELAKSSGFSNVNEYPGSFNNWVANEGELEGLKED